MKFDSPLFDSVRVKPSKDRRPRNDGPVCQWAGCAEKATNRAPKGRQLEKSYWHYCLKHVREYNQNYNFFAGMGDDAVLAYQKDALTGHRPTWKMGTGKRAAGRPDIGAAGDPFGVINEIGGRTRAQPDPEHKPEKRMIRNAERKALEVMGLEVGVSAAAIKMRFKELVKRHHPDANGGDRSSEDRLVEVIQSYNYLKSVGFG
jgi:hypothetical protein